MRLASLGTKEKGPTASSSECAVRPGPTQPPSCPMVNGFLSIPEPEALACKRENIATFTLPAEALKYEPNPDVVTVLFRNGDRERQIHCNTELRADELEQLAALQQAAQACRGAFFPSVTAMATRFLSTARGHVKKALKLMQATQEWRQHYFTDGPLRDDSVLEDMAHGIVYFSGRDNALRPALVVRGCRIPQQWYKERRVDKLVRLLVFCMEYMLRYMVVPGRVENLVVLVDLRGLSFSQVSISALGEVYKVMSNHYAGRAFRFYVCNLPHALHFFAGLAKSLLTDRQRQKLVVLDDVSELRQHFATHQLEQDLGGWRPQITQFYPFPLQAGPFDSGSEQGPDGAAAQDMHEVMTPYMAMCRLWDPSRSREDNVVLECQPPEAAALDPLPFVTLDSPPGACENDGDSKEVLRSLWLSTLGESTNGNNSSDSNRNNTNKSNDVYSLKGGYPDLREVEGATVCDGRPIDYSPGCLHTCGLC